ncbi:MAG TPA: ABC transporter ATP-binding protein [Candidatus Binatia bacterium]|jgi:iron complex transport system ATP-binding protein|nr:ABC transporter ATP-binding protein [Candidatus Binatia bacterium]
MSDVALALEGVHTRHPLAERDALRDLSLSVQRGEILALVGPNGSGKSTALATLGRSLAPRLGAVLLDGGDALTLPPRAFARRVARLPQSPICPEGITVSELVHGGRHSHRGFLQPLRDVDLAAAREAMRATDVLDLRHRRMETLSGGERRRAWLSMVLCQESPLLLLDEPTAALDLRHQRELLSLLRRLNAERQVTIVVVIHDLEQAAWIAHRVAVLHRGRLYAVGTPADALREDTLRDVFGVEARVTSDDDGLAVRVLGPCDPLRFL